MKDRADFARKGIARGRSLVVVQYADGIVFVSENLSQALHKVSEIYDRIAFAAVGRYNEFENLRIAGVRLADMRGYAYDRRDVTGRGLANAYAQTLGTIFSSGGEKPYEVEIFVAEVGDTAADDQIYRLTYDGQVADEHGYAVMGGVGRAGRRRTSRSTTPTGAVLEDADPAGRPGASARAQSETRRDPVDEPRGRGARPHPHPAAQVQAAHRRPARPRSSATAAAARRRGPRRRPAARRRAPSGPDDPADPTDTVGGRPAPGGPGHRRAARRTPRLTPGRRRRPGCGRCLQRHAAAPLRASATPHAGGEQPPPQVGQVGLPSRQHRRSTVAGMRADRDVVVGEVRRLGWHRVGRRALPPCEAIRGRPAGRSAGLAADPAGLRVPHAPDRSRAAPDVAAAAARGPAGVRQHGQGRDPSQATRARGHAAHPADRRDAPRRAARGHARGGAADLRAGPRRCSTWSCWATRRCTRDCVTRRRLAGGIGSRGAGAPRRSTGPSGWMDGRSESPWESLLRVFHRVVRRPGRAAARRARRRRRTVRGPGRPVGRGLPDAPRVRRGRAP